MKFKLSNQAKQSLKYIASYTYSTWGKEQMVKYISALDKAFELIAKNPKIGKSCDFVIKNIRSYPYESHVIYYRIKKTHINILDILHHKMEPRRRLGFDA